MTPDITILRQLTAARLDVSIWSARRKLTAADFGSSTLPPEKLASLGSKKVCNPDDLRIFSTLKARAVSVLERTGVRFLGGWAIPEARTALVVQELQRIGADFEAAKQDFLDRYHQSIGQWIADNPGWETLIAGSVVGVDTVRARLGFGWQVFTVAPPRGKGKGIDSGLETEVGSLAATLCGEIAQAAGEIWRKSYAGKAEVSLKALSPLRTLQDKLAGLSFIDPRMVPVADLLGVALARMPDKGPIAGEPLALVHGLLGLLQASEALRHCGQRLLDGEPAEDLLRELAGQGPALDLALPVVSELSVQDQAPGPLLDSLGLW